MADESTARGDAESGRKREARLAPALIVLALHVAVVVLGSVLAATARYSGPDAAVCQERLADDDLVHLGLRRASEQKAQIARWENCDLGAAADAKRAIRNDCWLIATIGAGFTLAFANVVRWRRWRVAAIFGGALALLYVFSDVGENLKLLDVLGGRGADDSVRWLAAVKFGSFAGALPLFLVSCADAVGKVAVARDPTDVDVGVTERGSSASEPDKAPSVAARVRQFTARWWRRLTTDPQVVKRSSMEASPSDPEAGPAIREEKAPGSYADKAALGVCCSGGGIRSAAFNLGALQALERRVTPGRPAANELAGANWISAVSGGSYLAAAWVTARAAQEKQSPAKRGIPTWSRDSPEERHLRRNASYMAPGVGGKLWALARFLFGFALNAAVIGLLLGVVFLPFGWLVDAYEPESPPPIGGTVELTRGGCLRLPNGRTVAALPATSLRLDGTPVTLFPNAPTQRPKESGSQRTAALTVESDGKTLAEATVSGRGLAGVVIDAAGVPAVGGVAIDGTTASSTGPTTTVARSATCPVDTVEPLTGVGEPADAVKAVLPAGTTFRLVLSEPLTVRGSARACSFTSPTPRSECQPEAAEVLRIPPGARLLQAPAAFLTVDDAVVVQPKGRDATVARACGGEACASFHRPRWLTVAVVVPLTLSFLLGISLVIARTSKGTARRSERWGRRAALVALVAWVVGFVLPWLVVWTENGRWGIEHRLQLTSSTGTLAVFAALLAQMAPFLGARSKTSTSGMQGKVMGLAKKAGARLRRLVIGLAGAVIGPLVVLAVGLGFVSYAAQQGFNPGQLGLALGLVGPLVLLLSGADLNEWSLHPYYRDRLRSAFAVDPRHHPPKDPREDPLDELPEVKPQLLICAAVNIADSRVTPPGRPVASWVFGRQGLGSPAMGTVAGADGKDGPGIVPINRLPAQYRHLAWTWTAVAVSGAAFSPAMGKMSRPERFLLALGNLRLGVWYPNPRYLEDDNERWWYGMHHPRPWYLAKEALGIHRVDDRWVYVTDGGHYENLGLVELIRRGCREIYCFDASGDRADTFGTIADAMRLTRQELGIEIRFRPDDLMKPDGDGISALGVWAGTVQYPVGEEGWIVVAKLAVPSTAPFDVIDLARTLPSFPNHPTADQLYTDQKFEAYRALGHHLGEQASAMATDIRAMSSALGSVGEAVAYVNSRRKAEAKAKAKAKAKPSSEAPKASSDPET